MMGGVIIPGLVEATLESLELKKGFDPNILLDVNQAVKELIIGEINAYDYCCLVIERTGSIISVDDLLKSIPMKATISTMMISLLEQLSNHYSLRLISDYPHQWLELIAKYTGLTRFFSEDKILILAEKNISNTNKSLIDFLVVNNMLIAGSSYWIDYNSLRTSQALRQGIDAYQYVDTPRMQHELGLRKLIPLER